MQAMGIDAGIDDVRRAAAVLLGVTVRTPVLRSDELDERVGARDGRNSEPSRYP